MVAQISPEIVTTVLDFIDYTIAAAVILAIYFGFRFLFYESEDEKRIQGEAVDKTREWVSNKWKESKEKKESEENIRKRKSLLEPAKGFLVYAEQNADHAIDAYQVNTTKGLHEGRRRVEQIQHNLKSARRILRGVRMSVREQQRQDVIELLARVDALHQTVDEQICTNFPTGLTGSVLAARVRVITGALRNVRVRCGELITAIDAFIDHDQRIVVEASRITAPRS